MIRELYIFLLLMGYGQSSYSQIIQEINPPDFIKTITIRNDNNPSQFPIIELGNTFELEFDVLNGLEEDYYYKINHYNFNWTKSDLSKSEYLSGYDNNKIYNYKNSFNTYQLYSHYELKIPNQDVQIKKSGNYIISVYNEYDEIMFSKKLIIYENLSKIKIGVYRSRELKDINQKQVIQFEIETFKSLNNPKTNVKSLIIKNNDLDQSISNLRPQYTIGNKLIYKYANEASFLGGNEFLNFENKDVRGIDINIRSFSLNEIYHNFLYSDYPRKNSTYTFNPDINGSFLVTAIDTDDSEIEADYVNVHFFLKTTKIDDSENIYVYGNFNGFKKLESNKMKYNTISKGYESIIKLKQGFYNYNYILENHNKELNSGYFSGNFDETENNYKVIIYYRNFGSRFDRVIGFNEINSTKVNN
ncbi:MAG: DUF5103 domain-containing protein [Flavobacteriaceae bacterium]|nr:DUF5103 domain-containing protein [Flavobacteriaceae bacterium]